MQLCLIHYLVFIIGTTNATRDTHTVVDRPSGESPRPDT